MKNLIAILILMAGTNLAWADKPIEIFVAGKRYASFADYKAAPIKPVGILVPLDSKDQTVIVDQAKALGVNVDPKMIKTIEVKPLATQKKSGKPAVSPKTAQKLEQMSADRNVEGEVSQFRQNWNNPAPEKLLNTMELEDKIREAVGDRTDPVLLMSDPKKMRIMALTPEQKHLSNDPSNATATN